MCDTLYVNRGTPFFGKNSDRNANEPNLVVFVPSKTYAKNSTVKCTYIEIPQVEKTNAVLLYKPSWMFGAEMGVNEYGVTIGNEAVFTFSKGKKVERLTGMDMLRLALERCQTAVQAVDTIVQLLEKFGQGGNCGFGKRFYYDNSFLIADGVDCFVVETSGKQYVVQNIGDQANISNRLHIGQNFDKSNLDKKIDFARKNREPVYSFFSGSEQRRSFVENKLQGLNSPQIDDIFGVLRGHFNPNQTNLFAKGSVKSVCMHAGGIGDHTTGSMVVQFRKDKPSTIWITGSSTPCLSIFKPCFFGVNVAPVFENQQTSLDYWLQREYFNRAVYAGLIDAKAFGQRAGLLENEFVKQEREIFSQDQVSTKQLEQFAIECSQSEQRLLNEYSLQIEQVKEQKAKLPAYWQKKTQTLGKNVFENLLP